MKILWQERTLSHTLSKQSTCQSSIVAKSRKQNMMESNKTVHYPQHRKQQKHPHSCASFLVLECLCPKGVLQWTQITATWIVGCSATGEPRARGSAPFIAGNKQASPLPPGSNQFPCNQAAVTLTYLVATWLATETAQGQRIVRPYGWHIQ